ncbi:cytidine deaminase-like protein [Thelephora terrestris]|uniref:Cytidine deaminase-like protein n=1 Tax=Thelephora terrestris TaxID=56493 RepID=A0A9P6LBB9_9AGAM|nr:cytidine deaminase-like protein [Thelephora terrestris]
MASNNPEHLVFMKIALEEAKKCIPVPTAFCVGCVVVVPVRLTTGVEEKMILSTGYSRELEGNTHAEANALAKARDRSPAELEKFFPEGIPSGNVEELLKGADVYTTLEPCSVRTSGLPACADALVDAQIRRCYIGVAEPDDFVECEGAEKLNRSGVEVVWLKGLERECLDTARGGSLIR